MFLYEKTEWMMIMSSIILYTKPNWVNELKENRSLKLSLFSLFSNRKNVSKNFYGRTDGTTDRPTDGHTLL